MTSTLLSAKRSVAFGAVGVLGLLGFAGAADAATSTTTPAAATPAHARAHRRVESLLSRADRATVELKVKGAWVTYDVDRGKVSAVSPTSITLGLADGQSVTEAIAPTTKFDGVTAAGAVTVGRRAIVISEGSTATRVEQRAPKAASAPATPAAS